MTAILSELPKQYNDSAKIIIQQHLRRNTSGTNSPSSPLSCSSPKLLLSPQLGPFSSLQNHHSSKYLARATSTPFHPNTDWTVHSISEQVRALVNRRLKRTIARHPWIPKKYIAACAKPQPKYKITVSKRSWAATQTAKIRASVKWMISSQLRSVWWSLRFNSSTITMHCSSRRSISNSIATDTMGTCCCRMPTKMIRATVRRHSRQPQLNRIHRRIQCAWTMR